MTKEQIYDEQIHPLMARIVAICQDHDIPVLASFHIPNDAGDLACTTAILPPESPASFRRAYVVLTT